MSTDHVLIGKFSVPFDKDVSHGHLAVHLSLPAFAAGIVLVRFAPNLLLLLLLSLVFVSSKDVVDGLERILSDVPDLIKKVRLYVWGKHHEQNEQTVDIPDITMDDIDGQMENEKTDSESKNGQFRTAASDSKNGHSSAFDPSIFGGRMM